MDRKKKSTLIRILSYVRPHWYYYGGAIICGIYKFVVPVFLIRYFGKAIDILQSRLGGTLSVEEAWQEILKLIASVVLIIVISPLPTYLRSTLSQKGTAKSIMSLRCDLYSHVYKLSHTFFDTAQTGTLVSRLIGDIDNTKNFLGNAAITVWMHMGLFVIIASYLVSLSPLLTGVAVLLIPAQIFIFSKLGRRMKGVSHEIRRKTAEMAGQTQERFSGMTVVKSFNGEDQEIRQFGRISRDLVSEYTRAGHLSGLSQSVLQLINNLAPLLLLSAGTAMALFRPELVSLSILVQFMMMQGQLYSPFAYLSETIIVTAEALGSLDRVFQLLDTEPDVTDREGARDLTGVRDKIEFRDVTFRYGSGEKPVLNRLNLTIPCRRMIALVGESGGGKSTVVKLLSRFYDVASGGIFVDGTEIRDIRVASLRQQIALVPQDPVLFSGTIRENILYGRPGATEDEVLEAARQAFAMDFIVKLPLGLDTVVGERGLLLSGGQRQRIAISRAFLKNPSVLIFDEATSALDTESEAMVQEAMERLQRDRTSIVIAHRLSTVINADMIAVIEGGELMEQGSHGELLARKGRYAALFEKQFGRES